MKRFLATALLATGLGVGCVERTFVITSDPPGALVYRNGKPIGTTPCDDHFVYYGKYQFTLMRDKFETLCVEEDICVPWYEIPPLDFLSENLWPFKLRDVHRLHYQLHPLQPANQQDVLQRAIELRARGKTIGAPAPPSAGPPVAPPPVAPAPAQIGQPIAPAQPPSAPPAPAGPG